MAKKLILNGIVQGVFCRKYCSEYARKMRIRGSASNLPDSTVKVLLDTDDNNLVDEYISNLKVNPMRFTFYGRIDHVDVSNFNGPIFGDCRF